MEVYCPRPGTVVMEPGRASCGSARTRSRRPTSSLQEFQKQDSKINWTFAGAEGNVAWLAREIFVTQMKDEGEAKNQFFLNSSMVLQKLDGKWRHCPVALLPPDRTGSGRCGKEGLIVTPSFPPF